MESNEISLHEVRVWAALSLQPEKWLTNREIQSLVTDVAARTVRHHTLKLVKLGLLDQMELFPGHRYRWSSKAGKRNPAYLQRLEQARTIFGC